MLRRPLLSFFFFFNDTATTEIYTLSLHDALPISVNLLDDAMFNTSYGLCVGDNCGTSSVALTDGSFSSTDERSEEHTSELQSPCNLVCRLLLEKKKP